MPPKKGQKMSLNDFLADESTGKTSWADEMDDLPIASAPRDNSYRRGGDYLASMPDRVDRDRGFERPERSYPPRDELPLPDKPPFTAFVGNLSFDVVDADVEDFFAPSQLVSVRIVTGHDGKPKGFGYVEFQSQDDLRAALDRSGSQLATRTVRISVAEPPKSGFGGDRAMHSSQADDASQWRRAAPLPPSEPRGGFAPRPERSGVPPRAEGSGFDNMDVSGGVRSGFGAKFQSAPPAAARPPREAAAPLEPSQADLANQWRTGKPVEGRSPANSRRPSGMTPDADSRRPSFRRNDANDVDDRFSSQERMGFGSKFTPDQTPPESPANAKKGFGFGAAERRGSGQLAGAPAPTDGVDNWRSAKKPASGSSSPAPQPAAAERKKLDLKPRSAEATAASASASATSSKPSPFGNAKPIDAAERERQIDEKLAQREKERQEELKAKKEKAKADKEKKDKAPAPTTSDKPQADSTQADASAPAATSEDSAPPAAAKAPRAPAPVGAWGGGRKPSGALVGGEQSPAAPKDDKSADSQVDEVAQKVDETKLDA